MPLGKENSSLATATPNAGTLKPTSAPGTPLGERRSDTLNSPLGSCAETIWAELETRQAELDDLPTRDDAEDRQAELDVACLDAIAMELEANQAEVDQLKAQLLSIRKKVETELVGMSPQTRVQLQRMGQTMTRRISQLQTGLTTRDQRLVATERAQEATGAEVAPLRRCQSDDRRAREAKKAKQHAAAEKRKATEAKVEELQQQLAAHPLRYPRAPQAVDMSVQTAEETKELRAQQELTQHEQRQVIKELNKSRGQAINEAKHNKLATKAQTEEYKQKINAITEQIKGITKAMGRRN